MDPSSPRLIESVVEGDTVYDRLVLHDRDGHPWTICDLGANHVRLMA